MHDKKSHGSFLKVNILLGHHNCLSVQCIDGACWISLGVRSPVSRLFLLPHSHSHRTRGYLCSFPITWPPPHLGERDILPIRELVKALVITKTRTTNKASLKPISTGWRFLSSLHYYSTKYTPTSNDRRGYLEIGLPAMFFSLSPPYFTRTVYHNSWMNMAYFPPLNP